MRPSQARPPGPLAPLRPAPPIPFLTTTKPLTQVREGLHYNPYFPGGAIAMPRMLADGGVEYDDGTPSSSSQQSKARLTAGWPRVDRGLTAV